MEQAQAMIEAVKKGDCECPPARRFYPLHAAAEDGQIEMAKLLLAHEADVTCTSQDGKTALNLAEARGNQNMVALLRQANRP